MQINYFQNKKAIHKKGISLVETVMYVSLLSILTITAVSGLMLINVSLQKMILSRVLDDAAQEVVEKLVREIRFAESVNLIDSSLGVNPSTLVLHSTDTTGTPVEVGFSLNGSALELTRDGVVSGPLTPNKVNINELIFDYIATPESEAIKISLVLTAERPGVYIEEPFNTTVILRGSY